MLSFRYRRPPGPEVTFESELLSAGERMLVLAHRLYPRQSVTVDGEVVLEAGSMGVWFLFKGLPFDVARVYSPSGTFRGYYVDALEPVHWQDSSPDTLDTLVDLFLDLWIWPDRRYAILDEAELVEALRQDIVTEAQAQSARQTVDELTLQIEEKTFPPSHVTTFELDPNLFSALHVITSSQPISNVSR